MPNNLQQKVAWTWNSKRSRQSPGISSTLISLYCIGFIVCKVDNVEQVIENDIGEIIHNIRNKERNGMTSTTISQVKGLTGFNFNLLSNKIDMERWDRLEDVSIIYL